MHPTINMEATGKRLRQIMEYHKLSVKDIQQYLNLSCVQSIYHWLNGTSIPSLDNLYALSKLFQMPIDQIIVGNRNGRDLSDHRIFYVRMFTYHMAFKWLLLWTGRD